MVIFSQKTLNFFRHRSCQDTKKCILPKLLATTVIACGLLYGGPVGASDLSDNERAGLAQKFISLLGPKYEALEQKREKEFLEENPLARLQDGEELIFSLRKGSLVFNEPLFTRKDNNRLYLSLQDLIAAFDFPINVDVFEKTASGWFIRENQTFRMDLEAGEIVADGQQILLEDENYIIDEEFGTIYIDEFVIEQAFGLDFDFKINELQARFNSDQALPVEERLYRQQRKDNLIFVDREPVLPEIRQDYKLFTTPSVDVQITNSFRKREDRDADTLNRYSVITANDTLYGGLKTYLTGDDTNKVEQFRFLWNREAADGEDFGIGGIKSIQIGDITTPRLGLFSGGGQEFGVKVANTREFVQEEETLETTRFEGDIQPGWDIELYRNSVLLRTTRAGSDGRYLFEDVPLTFGENEFRLVFYGPQGQIDERTETIIRNQNRFDVGEVNYSLSLTNQNQITFENRGNVNRPNSGTPNLIAAADFGLTDQYSVGVSGRLFEREKEQIGQVSASLTSYTEQLILEGTLGLESTGEYGLQATALSTYKGQSIRGIAEYNTDKFDQPASSTSNTKLFLQGSVSGALTEDKLASYIVDADYREQTTGDSRMELTGSVSRRIRRGILGAGYSYVNQDIGDREISASSVVLNGRYTMGKNSFRGVVNYNITPELEPRTYLASWNRFFNNNLSGELQVEYVPITGLTEYEARLNYRNDYFIWSPNVEVTSENDVRAFSSLRFGLGADPYSDRFKVSGRGLTSTGGVSARVFFDENNNGVWDFFESPIEGVTVEGVQIKKADVTDDTGVAFIPTLNQGQATDIKVDKQSFEDPYFIALNEGNSIKARAGRISRLDFPVGISGEVDGTISFYDARGRLKPLRNITVFLVDMDGKIRASGQTAFDGFYVIGDIYPGDYKLILDPIAIEQNNFVQIQPKGYAFRPTGNVFFDQNFITFSERIKPEVLSDIYSDTDNDRRIVLELGRFNSKLLLAVKWMQYRAQFGRLMAGLGMFEGLVENDKNQADEKFPLHVGPIKDIQRAESICKALEGYKVPCTLRSISIEEDAKDKKV